MADLALGVALGALTCWLCTRPHTTPRPTVYRVPALSHMRTRQGTSDPPIGLPASAMALGQITAPTEAALHLWLLSTDDHPIRYRPGQPRLTGEPDTVTPFGAGAKTLLRAARRISTDEEQGAAA